MRISPDDFLFFIDRALDGMVSIVEELGDTYVNLRPKLPGANSPYVILTHCLGVTHYWIGEVLAGRQAHRDRDAEFQAQGTVAEICQKVRALQQQLREDMTHVQGEQPLAFPVAPRHSRLQHWRQGAALIHAYEELAQHHGQMEITRDLLLHQ